MATHSFSAIVANGVVHLTMHHQDHPDETVRMPESAVPHLVAALGNIGGKEPAVEKPHQAASEEGADGEAAAAVRAS